MIFDILFFCIVSAHLNAPAHAYWKPLYIDDENLDK